MSQQQQQNQNQDKAGIAKGTNEFDVKVAEVKAQEKQTNEHDVGVTKANADMHIKVAETNSKLEQLRIESAIEAEKFKAELEDNTNRTKIYADAVRGVIGGGMMLAAFIIRTRANVEVAKHKIEFGRD